MNTKNTHTTNTDKPLDVSKYSIGLFEKAKKNVRNFLGKYPFGKSKIFTNVLLPKNATKPTYRDKLFKQGKKLSFNNI